MKYYWCVFGLWQKVIECQAVASQATQIKLNTMYCSPGPGPSSQMFDNNSLPELPSVPDTLPSASFGKNTTSSDDIDFDDLTRRFEELKKKT